MSCLKYFVLAFCLNHIEGSFRCDYKYSSKAQAWFKPSVVPANWFDARLRCSLEGAVLASPVTPEILAEMRNIMNRSYPEYEIFTGIHATVSQGDYYTIEGTPLSKIPVGFAENEPDNKNNIESCITINVSAAPLIQDTIWMQEPTNATNFMQYQEISPEPTSHAQLKAAILLLSTVTLKSKY
ncbi:hypothetical protein PYW07_009911 [Mythimna separata]|uniref:C-type lectin domain-containing protein n=1 Tax=Mythimna separata TaxID=271217 RepID=A0AAD8DQI1_MYTSE|nr:hypothetical protein PYW07_009911 [Mythimna separata]